MAGCGNGQVKTNGIFIEGSGSGTSGAGSNTGYTKSKDTVGKPGSECPSGGGCDCECKSCSSG